MYFGEIERLLLSINVYVPRGKSDKSLSNDKTVGITKKRLMIQSKDVESDIILPAYSGMKNIKFFY